MRAISLVLLLTIAVLGMPHNTNAMHEHRAEECLRIAKAELFHNKSSWFLKVQIAAGEYNKSFEEEINLQENPVDIRVGWVKDTTCLLEQYPQEYKNATKFIVFVPTLHHKTMWSVAIEYAEISHRKEKAGFDRNIYSEDPNFLAVPSSSKYKENEKSEAR